MTNDNDQLGQVLASFLGLDSNTYTNYVSVPCANCKTPIVLPRATLKQRQQDGRAFFCPQGHSNVYSPSENEKLTEENTALKKALRIKQEKIDKLTEKITWLDSDNERAWKAYQEAAQAARQRTNQIKGHKSHISKLKKQLKEQTP